jgi:thioredoxin reductase (NADPH)
MGEHTTKDVIIIGAGPTGLNCAIAAQQAGLDYLIIEKGVLVNSIFNFPANMTFFSTSKKLEIGDIPFISHSDKPTRREALEYYRRIVESYQLNIHYRERVESVVKQDDGIFALSTKRGTYNTRKVIVTTGYYDIPKKLNIPGEELPKVKHYYDEAHPYIGQKVVVVGGANSACDVALETWQKGADVTMVVRETELYQRVKYWILPNIENRIKEGSIKAYFNSQLTRIEEEKVYVHTPDGDLVLDNDYVLAMTGYMPDYSFMEKIGISFHDDDYRTPVFNPDTLESRVPGLYIAGVILGGYHTSKLFIENTREHGAVIMNDIVDKSCF